MRLVFKTFIFSLILLPAFGTEKDTLTDSSITAPHYMEAEIPRDEKVPPVFEDSSSVASQEEEIDESGGPAQVNVQSRYKTSEEDDESGEIRIILEDEKDIKNASCGICCLKTSRSFWSIATSWFGFGEGITSACQTSLVTLMTLGDSSPKLKKWLGAAATIVSASNIAFGKLTDSGYKNAIKNQKELQSIEKRITEILNANQEPTMSVKFKGNRLNLSATIQQEYDGLLERYQDLTKLTSCENCYFSCSNYFLRGVHTVSKNLELLCKVGNLIMIPLSSIPVWEPTTATNLGIAVICLEGGTILFKEIAKQSRATNKSMRNLKKDLGTYN